MVCWWHFTVICLLWTNFSTGIGMKPNVDFRCDFIGLLSHFRYNCNRYDEKEAQAARDAQAVGIFNLIIIFFLSSSSTVKRHLNFWESKLSCCLYFRWCTEVLLTTALWIIIESRCFFDSHHKEHSFFSPLGFPVSFNNHRTQIWMWIFYG